MLSGRRTGRGPGAVGHDVHREDRDQVAEVGGNLEWRRVGSEPEQAGQDAAERAGLRQDRRDVEERAAVRDQPGLAELVDRVRAQACRDEHQDDARDEEEAPQVDADAAPEDRHADADRDGEPEHGADRLATRLDGGSYDLICYSLQSPRGTLAVSGGAAQSRPPSAVVDAETLSGYQAAYSEYVRAEAAALVTAIEPFVAGIEAGDLEAAKAAYAPSRPHWERIEPVAELFSDLDTRMDAREEAFALGVEDPEFLGWHRLEKGLWADGTTDGLAPIAVGLRDDVTELKQRLDELDIEPRVMARGAGELIEEVAQSKLTGEEDRYSEADLWSIEASVAGSKKIVDILRAPLGADREEDLPVYDGDPDGARIPLDAHIRKANPRTSASERSLIFRRGYSYSRGFDDAGLLDQGLLFVCFQRDVKAGFLAVQKRLAGEPLEEYIRPVGGGYFFALPGVASADGFLGEGLLRA